jgi:hypothetical protein
MEEFLHFVLRFWPVALILIGLFYFHRTNQNYLVGSSLETKRATERFEFLQKAHEADLENNRQIISLLTEIREILKTGERKNVS